MTVRVNIVSLFRSHKYDENHLLLTKTNLSIRFNKASSINEINDNPYFQLGHINFENLYLKIT